tara:strand:+ start:988 stop:2514 length:1527 start_codon:yes stop_codon:yes gene_type:complete
MAVKRYFASKDNTITNAFKANLITRGTGSNMGASDILEAFVIHGQTSASINADNAEQARILIQFPVEDIVTDISNGTVPSSSVEYRLVMTNAPHADSTPIDYGLEVAMVSGASWIEGTGLDMEEYTDRGVCNWLSSSDGTVWPGLPRVDNDGSNEGASYFTGSAEGTISGTYHFSGGLEDLNLDVTFAIDKWRRSPSGADNYGFLIKHTNDVISGSSGSFFTKRFFGRTSDYFLNRPYIEARWDSSRKDNRPNAVRSSSLAPASFNINDLYLYNTIRGQLQPIPNTTGSGQHILVSFYSGTNTSPSSPTGNKLHVINDAGSTVLNVTGGRLVENDSDVTGVYSCSFASTTSFTTLHDVWHSGGVEYFTGSFQILAQSASALIYDESYISDITNLKNSYYQGEKPRLRVFVRKKNWQPNIYTVATADVETDVIEDAYWRLYRVIDDREITPYGTSSYNFTKMSYDISGNYFELDTTHLDPGYSYGIQFLYYINGVYKEQPDTFKFKLDE